MRILRAIRKWALLWVPLSISCLIMLPILLRDLADWKGVRLAALPVTPLADLRGLAGTGRLVRVRAKMLGQPAITDGTGARLAYKAATQVSTGRHSSTDDTWWVPGEFEVGEGTRHITVDSSQKALDERFIPRSASNGVVGGKVPADIAPLLAPDFSKLEPIDHDDIRVFTIGRGAMVTIFGEVVLQNGKLTLRAPNHRYSGIEAGRLIVSPLDDEELVAKLGGAAGNGVLAFAMMLVFFLAVFGLVILIARKTQRDAAKLAAKP